MIDRFITPVYAQADRAARLCDLDEMIVGVFDKIWPFAGLAVFFMFIYGGAMWMMSTGDPQKIAKATNTFLWAFIGAAILALLMVIMGTFEHIFGLPDGTLRVLEINC